MHMTPQMFLMKYRKWLLLFSVLGLMVTVLMGYLRSQDAPPVKGMVWQTLEDKPSELSQYRGQVVLVNFWATTCGTCIAEMPLLQATQQKYQLRAFKVLAVAVSSDEPAAIYAFVKASRLPFVFGYDRDGLAAKAFGGVQVTPVNILLDAKGRVIKRFLGVPNEGELHRLIDAALVAS
jgi:thiol-disulfide isomerase/thioredoxin